MYSDPRKRLSSDPNWLTSSATIPRSTGLRTSTARGCCCCCSDGDDGELPFAPVLQRHQRGKRRRAALFELRN
eukprot:276187-Pelagomonas_calceolata.AAC.2